MFGSFLTNWKTTSSGVVMIMLALGSQFFGLTIPGLTESPGTLLLAGIGMLSAKDGNVTGGTTIQPH